LYRFGSKYAPLTSCELEALELYRDVGKD